VDGGLYSFPLSFEFIYVGINANLPQPVIDRFSQRSSITVSELMEIYIYLQQEYNDEFGHLNMGVSLDQALRLIIADFIDFETRTSHLNDGRFASLLDDKQLISDMWTEHTPENGGTAHVRLMESMARRVAFLCATNALGFGINQPAFMSKFFESPTPSFTHFIPLSDDSGRLILEQRVLTSDFSETWGYRIFPSWGSININAAGNSALAWEFTRHLIPAFVNHSPADMIAGDPLRGIHDMSNFLRHTLDTHTTPIERSYTADYTIAAFEHHFREDTTMQRTYYGIPDGTDARRTYFENALARLEAFNEMPAAVAPHISRDFYENIIFEFSLGVISAQQAAQEIHNRIALWLIE
jgi:hypothetical protein